MWKFPTTQIRKKIYNSLVCRGLFLEKEKGCDNRTRGTVDLLCIDEQIIKKGKTREKTVAMGSIDYKITMI